MVFPKVSTRLLVLLLILILAVGIFLRVYQLGTESLWYDEASSVQEASMSLTAISQHSNQPPLYYIILNSWINLFGTSEVALRSLSAIFGVISLLLIYYVGSTLFNRRVGLISALLASISYYLINLSQEARNYSLLLILALLSYLFFIKILQNDRKLFYPFYFLATLLMGYTHVYGLLIIISQFLYLLLFWNKYKLQRLKLGITWVITIVGLVPLVLLLGGRAVSIAAQGFWIPKPGLRSIIDTLTEFSGTGQAESYIFLAFFLLAILGFFSIKSSASELSWKAPVKSLKGVTWSLNPAYIEEEVLLLIWLFVSIVIPFIESRFLTPVYLTKYMIAASPALYLLVAKGLDNLNRKWLLYPALILIILLSSLGLYQYYTLYTKQMWREAANFIENNGKAGSDIILFSDDYPYVRTPFNYYYKGDIPEFGIKTDMLTDGGVASDVENAIQGEKRLWWISDYTIQTEPVEKYLTDRYGSQSIIMRKEFFGILILLYSLSPP
jgi:mannosyltransferase